MMTTLLLLALALPAAAQTAKSVDDPSWWWNTPVETVCHKDWFDAAFHSLVDSDNKRLKQYNLVSGQLKALRCAKDDVTAQQWRASCGGKRGCIGENAQCPGLRKALPQQVDFFADVDNFSRTTGNEYQQCSTRFTEDADAARKQYSAAKTQAAQPALDPRWADKSCAQLKKMRDIVSGLAVACLASPGTCALTAIEITSLELQMKTMGCS